VIEWHHGTGWKADDRQGNWGADARKLVGPFNVCVSKTQGRRQMTRQSQKESERGTLDVLLSALSMTPDKIDDGDQPDFMLTVCGRTIGVEVRMYQSGTTVGAGFGQRQVESEWEALQLASREFRAAQADIATSAWVSCSMTLYPRGESIKSSCRRSPRSSAVV
jgi:hypothetical protein